MSQVQLFNTLSRRKEVFTPIKKGRVSLYACGPTVYDFAHIGNLRTYIFEDILRRTLEYNKLKVKHIENITDVGHLVSDADDGQDKMMKALEREGLDHSVKSLLKLAEKYTDAFRADMKLLNIEEPDKWTKATDHIKDMIKLIERIEKNGYAYQTGDGLYFDTAKFETYGKMANLDKAELQAGARVEVNKEKRNPYDFALWIKAVGENEKHVMQWESPWGTGFPGWHIECSAMSMKYLGEKFDIHTGGIDHIPVHHTNEIAQNQSAVGHQVVHVWMHGEFLVVDEKRMGKSEGNLLTLQRLVEKNIEPLAYRYLCLQTHYRQQLNFSWEAVEAAENALTNLWAIAAGYDTPKGNLPEYEEQFLSAINDDLNTAQALAVVWKLVKDQDVASAAKKKTLLKFDQVLGLGLAEQQPIVIPSDVQKLIDKREQARAHKDWETSDALRDQITALGFSVDDTPAGSVIKKAKK